MSQEEFKDVNWHALEVSEVLRLQNTRESGLDQGECQARLAKYGKNELTPPPKPGFLRKLFDQLNNILIVILVVAAIVSGIIEEWAEVALICGVIIINVTIGLIQEGRAEKAADAIKGMLSSKATVIRNGERQVVEAAAVVPGDIVFIQSGDRVPADIRVFDVSNCQIMEAMLTGESNPITKHIKPVAEESAIGDRKNLAFSATMVQSGQAKGIVIGTGDYAEIGRISALVGNVEQVKTNLMVQLEMFGRWVSLFVLIVGAITFCLAFFARDEDGITAFTSTVSIAVAIIPEGLPTVVTISLALAMQMLAKNNAIIRQLPAVETLGSCSTICSDKTGTLTKNEMTVQKIQTAKAQYDVEGVGYAPEGGIAHQGKRVEGSVVNALRTMFEGAVLCNDAGIQSPEDAGAKTWTPIGYPTEVSLITLLMKLGVGYKDIKPLKDSKPRVGGVPFASENKFMCNVHSDGSNGSLVLHVKGAPDRLIPKCKDQVMNDDLGKTGPIDQKFWQDKAAEMASLGLRTLAVCRASWDKSKTANMDADVITKAQPFLTMVGIVAILDPPRPEAIEAVKVANQAGIVVKMITGDHPQTAIAIGKMLGLVPKEAQNYKAYTGPEIDKMTEEQLQSIVLDCNVFARASPENKTNIVKALQARGQICSMTGDGVNDAPALKKANIGVAMGITGTDVSKEAAKMVLADDNFATIVKAVKEGRRVWDNLVKILLYNMPVNLAQGLSVLFAYVIDLEPLKGDDKYYDSMAVPLTAIQVLYVNMITSVTMGLMLAMEPAEDTIMTRPPRNKNKKLFGKMVMWHCFFVSLVIVAFVEFNFWLTLDGTDPDADYVAELAKARRAGGGNNDDPRMNKARAVAFNMLVFGEIAYALNCRNVRGTPDLKTLLFGNYWCWISIAITIILQIFLTYTPTVNTFFSNAAIGGEEWVRILGFSVIVFFIVEFEKFFGPKYLMPIMRPTLESMGCFATGGEEETTNPDHVHFWATGGSSVGMAHPHDDNRERRLSGTSMPVISSADAHAKDTKIDIRPPAAGSYAGNDFPAASGQLGNVGFSSLPNNSMFPPYTTYIPSQGGSSQPLGTQPLGTQQPKQPVGGMPIGAGSQMLYPSSTQPRGSAQPMGSTMGSAQPMSPPIFYAPAPMTIPANQLPRSAQPMSPQMASNNPMSLPPMMSPVTLDAAQPYAPAFGSQA